MDRAAWREMPLGREHDRTAFDCGNEALNLYLRVYARQNSASGGSRTYVAVLPSEPKRILAYYTISPGEIEFPRVPSELTRGLGRYAVPVFRLGRLAVDRLEQGRGLGATLLAVAADRALNARELVGGLGLAIDAKNAEVASWYARHGAVPFLDDPLKLLLPFATIAKADRLGR